jgi:uncharacterized protein (DUF362 family)
MNNIVSLVRSEGHYEGVRASLEEIEELIKRELKGKERLLVKPNFVSVYIPLSATHVDAVHALLDFITQHYSGKITIAEGPSAGSIWDGIENYGYMKLKEKFDLDFVDLNQDEFFTLDVFDRNLHQMKVRVARFVIESDCKISITRPKTHDVVIATLSIKNMVVGSLINHDKSRIHQGYRAINLNIARIARKILPFVGVIDGFVGMEGNGPELGSAVNFGIAATSTNPVALDRVVATAMGFDPENIGYLHHLGGKEVEVKGARVEDVKIKFRPHSAYREQLSWR